MNRDQNVFRQIGLYFFAMTAQGVLPVYAILRASILDFRLRLANRCRVLPVFTLFRASILDFKPRLENRCSAIAATVRNGSACSGRSGNDVRVRF